MHIRPSNSARALVLGVVAVGTLALLAGSTLAQPTESNAGNAASQQPGPDETTKTRRPNLERARAEMADPEVAKQRLRRMIEENTRRGERLEQALKEIEAGKDPRDVLREFAGERLRGGQPAGQMGGPREGDGPGFGPRGNRPGDGGDRDLNGLGGVIDMGGPSRPLSDEEREQVQAVLKERLPRVAERLDALAAQEPEVARTLVDRVGARVLHAEQVRQASPELADLRLAEIEHGSDAISAARDWRRAKRADDAAAVESAATRLRDAISKVLDTRLKMREGELSHVTRNLEKMREDLSRFQAERDRVVERTFRQMTERAGRPGPGGPGPKREGADADDKPREAKPDRARPAEATPRE